MTAAAITPTSVQKTYLSATSTVGTADRLVEFFVVLTKAATDDWVTAATYTPGTVVSFDAITIDSNSDGAQEIMTYADTLTKLVLPGATTGTTYMRVICIEE